MDKHNLNVLQETAPTARAVSRSEQISVVNALRSSPSLKIRREIAFADISDVISFLRGRSWLAREVLWSGYNIDHEPLFIAKLGEALDTLDKCSTILSLDGFVICNTDFTAGVIADYEEVSGTRSSGEVYLSLLGRSTSD